MSNFVLDGLLPSDDLPHRLVDAPHWSENYLSVAAFPDAGAGHWLHLGRTPWDPHLWQEMFCFALPEDRYLVSRATACTSDVDGPRAAGLSYRCVEPFRRWTKTFRGGARLMTGAGLRAGPMTEGPLVGVDLELEWNAVGPAFTMDTSHQSWTDAHYEQYCEITGRIAVDGTELPLAGRGLRDHSWGPRDFSPIGRHCWIHARWPDGRAFMIFHLISADQSHTLSHVAVDLGDGMQPARFAGDAPLVDDLDGTLRAFRLELETEAGHPVVIDGNITQALTLSMIGTNELAIGACPDASHWLVEAQTTFTWDDAISHGLTERTVDRRRTA